MTWTGALDPAVAFTEAVLEKLGEVLCDVSGTVPVLKIASRTDELSGGTDVGLVTPGNPGTPVQLPIGNVKPCPPATDVPDVLVLDDPLPDDVLVPDDPLPDDVLVLDDPVPDDPVPDDVLVLDDPVPDDPLPLGGVTAVTDAISASRTHLAATTTVGVWLEGGAALVDALAPPTPDRVSDALAPAPADADRPASCPDRGLAEPAPIGAAGAAMAGTAGEGRELEWATAGTDSPPAARATSPRTTEPRPPDPAVETTACAAGVDATCPRNWMLVPTGEAEIAAALDELAGDDSACAPAAVAGCPAEPENVRRTMARKELARSSGVAASVPEMALALRSVRRNVLHARLT